MQLQKRAKEFNRPMTNHEVLGAFGRDVCGFVEKRIRDAQAIRIAAQRMTPESALAQVREKAHGAMAQGLAQAAASSSAASSSAAPAEVPMASMNGAAREARMRPA